jgi:membrane-associated protein
MNFIRQFIDFLVHLDRYVGQLIDNYGLWTYLFLWLIIFCETGLVVTPFLPGDSLLFVAGTFAAIGSFKIIILFLILWSAAVIGDSVNYWIGYKLGNKVFSLKNSRLFNQKNYDKTYQFYEKYGSVTIVLARFVPIFRTFAPFVAGVAKMKYLIFALYNILGGFLWVSLFVFGGYFFGNIPIIRNNFGKVIILIILISVLPIIIKLIKIKKPESK